MAVKLSTRTNRKSHLNSASPIVVEYLKFDDFGVAYLAGTRMTVKQIAREATRCKYSIQDIVQAHPDLSQPMIEAALAYYEVHKILFDQQMIEDDEFFEQKRKDQAETLSVKTLIQRKALAR